MRPNSGRYCNYRDFSLGKEHLKNIMHKMNSIGYVVRGRLNLTLKHSNKQTHTLPRQQIQNYKLKCYVP